MTSSGPGRRKWTERNFITEVFIPSLFQRKSGTRPLHPPVFPVIQPGQFCITWIGHASFLIQTLEHNILIDPNWANWLLVVKRLRHAGMALKHLPNIDLVLITHAHFDHLNRKTLRAIASRQPIIVPNGVSSLVHGLGFEQVLEVDWWDTLWFDDLKITFTPAKHWGARTLLDQHRKYGGYVMEYKGRAVYHGGDSAYFDGFSEIGRRLEPDISLLPIGAYQPPSFRDNHMGPEQALDAFVELKSKVFIPMHYGTYRLSYEPMHEPPQRLMKEAALRGLLPKIRFMMEGMPQIF